MLTNINAIKVCKLLYICAIIFDFFYWILKKLQYFMFLFYVYSTKFQKLQTSARTDLAPDARLFSHLAK